MTEKSGADEEEEREFGEVVLTERDKKIREKIETRLAEEKAGRPKKGWMTPEVAALRAKLDSGEISEEEYRKEAQKIRYRRFMKNKKLKQEAKKPKQSKPSPRAAKELPFPSLISDAKIQLNGTEVSIQCPLDVDKIEFVQGSLEVIKNKLKNRVT